MSSQEALAVNIQRVSSAAQLRVQDWVARWVEGGQQLLPVVLADGANQPQVLEHQSDPVDIAQAAGHVKEGQAAGGRTQLWAIMRPWVW